MQEPVSRYIHTRILSSGWVGLTEMVCCLWSGRSAQILHKSCNQKHYCPSHSTSHQPGLSTHGARKMPCRQSSRLQLAAACISDTQHMAAGHCPPLWPTQSPPVVLGIPYISNKLQLTSMYSLFPVPGLIRVNTWLEQRLDVNRFSCWSPTRPKCHGDL